MVSIKVDGISARASVSDLEYLFEKYGKIGDIYIPRERYSKDNRGFAFVRYFENYIILHSVRGQLRNIVGCHLK